MFSSIAAFIFGSSTTEGTNCKPIEDSQICYLTNDKQRKESLEADSNNIETIGEYQQGIHNNNKRNDRKNKGKKPVLNKIKAVTIEPAPILDVVTSELSDVDFDLDDDWLLVQKGDVDIPNSFFRKGSKENLILAEHNNRTSTPISEILNITTVQKHNICNNSSQTLQNNYEKHKPDLTSGFSQASSGPTAVQLSPLNNLGYIPSESVVNVANKTRLLTDNNDAQLLQVANHSKDLEPNLSSVSIDSNGSGAKLFTMVDSWYMTPPPCFISTGPIYMEMSPFENLLIEHPSMSIYHSIKTAQKTSESFVKFDVEVSESSQIQEEKENFYTQKSHEIVFVKPSAAILEQKTEPNIRKSAKTPRVDHCNAANLKMELFALNSQKVCIV
ncbi:uncharacterized protein LOC126755362 isoform X2 [Bactrocera neohumeralis]|uniref:uncharacterized protein LOC120771576 isoform X2 n=1 Tax=Bactrocera tryoni TaxID=59916 RepID=UPI001A967A93|nr:uncharacterized protein LOC120771576 isoform X2 [Bactrocera tryoni]XP_050323835.1 uncharacterized protein LOC126755362 isoform X2 [Bactrocera neohumeralis]